MRCLNCGGEIKPEDIYCNHCGMELSGRKNKSRERKRRSIPDKGAYKPSRTNLCGDIRNTRKNNIMITITIHKKPTIMVTILTNFMENKPKWMGKKFHLGNLNSVPGPGSGCGICGGFTDIHQWLPEYSIYRGLNKY